MTSKSNKPLEILKKGLGILQKKVQTRKEKLKALLSQKKAISSADELWLDQEANLVDEEVIVALENASDYEQAVGRLDEKGKEVVWKPRGSWDQNPAYGVREGVLLTAEIPNAALPKLRSPRHP